MSRVQSPSVTPIFSLQKISKNLSIRNSVEPASAGLDELKPVLGTPRDIRGPTLASFGFTLASRISPLCKALHPISHPNLEISRGQRPPCNLLVFLASHGLARSGSLLTTRPQRVMAGGQQLNIAAAMGTKNSKQQGGRIFNF